MALLIGQLKIWQETGRERGEVTRSKRTWAGSQTQVRCRASAHGMHGLPTELNGAPMFCNFSIVACILSYKYLCTQMQQINFQSPYNDQKVDKLQQKTMHVHWFCKRFKYTVTPVSHGSLLNWQYLICMSIKVKGGQKCFLAMDVLCKPGHKAPHCHAANLLSGHLQDTLKLPQAHISN